MTVTLSLSYLRYLCFFTSTVVISIHRLGITPLYIQEGVQNDHGMAAVSHELEHGKQRGSKQGSR
jgi:hypothetical protein